MIADRAMPTLGALVLTVPSLGACLDCLRLSSNRPRRALGTVSPSLPAPAAELIRSTRILSLCATLPRSQKRQDSTSPRKCRAGRLSLLSCTSLRVSGTLREVSHHAGASGFSQALQSFALTPKIIMAHQSRSGTVQFALDISPDARLRFESLHQSMGLKTKVQTFEAILYFVSTKDKIDPAALQRMEKKIDHSIHLLESLT
jgi:hypothetical protein